MMPLDRESRDKEQTTFCEECRKDVNFIVENISLVGTLKGKEYCYTGQSAICAKCGAEVYVAEIQDNNLRALYIAFTEELNRPA